MSNAKFPLWQSIKHPLKKSWILLPVVAGMIIVYASQYGLGAQETAQLYQGNMECGVGEGGHCEWFQDNSNWIGNCGAETESACLARSGNPTWYPAPLCEAGTNGSCVLNYSWGGWSTLGCGYDQSECSDAGVQYGATATWYPASTEGAGYCTGVYTQSSPGVAKACEISTQENCSINASNYYETWYSTLRECQENTPIYTDAYYNQTTGGICPIGYSPVFTSSELSQANPATAIPVYIDKNGQFELRLTHCSASYDNSSFIYYQWNNACNNSQWYSTVSNGKECKISINTSTNPLNNQEGMAYVYLIGEDVMMPQADQFIPTTYYTHPSTANGCYLFERTDKPRTAYPGQLVACRKPIAGAAYSVPTASSSVAASSIPSSSRSSSRSSSVSSSQASSVPVSTPSISNCTQLQNMKYNLAGNYTLTQDVNCAESVNWNAGAGFLPIGDNTNRFTGTLNGQGFKITGLYVQGALAGLFGVMENAAVQDLFIQNIAVDSATGRAGALAAFTYPGVTIENVRATGFVEGVFYVGGLVGVLGGSITESYFEGSVTAACCQAGGLVGAVNATGVISDSYAIANVTAQNDSGVSDVGGLVGANIGTIRRSYAGGTVNGIAHIGGVAGQNNATGLIVDSFGVATVAATTSPYRGGIVGFGGSTTPGTITRSYWNSYPGGPTNCYDNGNVGCTSVSNNTSHFYSANNQPLASWNFSTIWTTKSNDLPKLRAFEPPAASSVSSSSSSAGLRACYTCNSGTKVCSLTPDYGCPVGTYETSPACTAVCDPNASSSRSSVISPASSSVSSSRSSSFASSVSSSVVSSASSESGMSSAASMGVSSSRSSRMVQRVCYDCQTNGCKFSLTSNADCASGQFENLIQCQQSCAVASVSSTSNRSSSRPSSASSIGKVVYYVFGTYVTPYCGDGVVQPKGANNIAGDLDDEVCDSKNRSICTARCKKPVCGDGILHVFGADGFQGTGDDEECDDGNTNNSDLCTSACKLSGCGDGIVQPAGQNGVLGDGDDEQCDDKNKVNADGCSNTCKLPICGDKVVQAGEQCDDGNKNDTDFCTNQCRRASCGDGIIQPFGPDGFQGSADDEQCDDGSLNVQADIANLPYGDPLRDTSAVIQMLQRSSCIAGTCKIAQCSDGRSNESIFDRVTGKYDTFVDEQDLACRPGDCETSLAAAQAKPYLRGLNSEIDPCVDLVATP